jgi:hypothetical protein
MPVDVYCYIIASFPAQGRLKPILEQAKQEAIEIVVARERMSCLIFPSTEKSPVRWIPAFSEMTRQ